MSTVRIDGKDRVLARSVLLPKRSTVAINRMLGTHIPPALVTESLSTEKGRQLGVRGYPMTLEQLAQAAINGDF